MPVYSLGDHTPQIHPDAWVAETATIVGNVTVAAGANIWYGCVLRCEFDSGIVIGEGASVQDNTVVHADPGLPVTVGKHVLIGHATVIHGCTIEDGALIGIHASVLNGAVVGAEATIAAGAVVREGQKIPPGVLAAGVPAQVVRKLDESQRQRPAMAAQYYVRNGQDHATKRSLLR